MNGLKKVLSISPWPSIWVMGKGGGSPSEGYVIQALVKAGFEVTHLAPVATGLPAFEKQEHVRFIRISNPFARLQPIIKTGVGFFYRLPAVSAWSLVVSDWLRKSGEGFDLVVGHGLESAFALRRAARYLGVPAISRLYGTSAPIEQLRGGLLRERYFDLLFILRHPPDHIVLTDDGTCGDEVLRIFRVPDDRCDFLINGYDPSLLSMKCKESSPPYVLTATRLIEEKRVDRFIRIAAICKKSLPEVQFIILGDGPRRRMLEKLTRKLGVSSNVHFWGNVSRAKVHEMLSGASVILSTQEVSNINNTVLEALVLGKPVVTLDVGCTRKFIRHGQTGLLYKPYDLEGAARGIERLMREKSFRKDLGRRAKEFYRRVLLTWPERLNQEVAIYRRFIGSS